MMEDDANSGGERTPQALRYRRADRAVEALASAQHGVVTRGQILAVGVSPGILERRLGSKLLKPLHRGVYLVGPVESNEARALGAVLACGSGAVLGHWSAASIVGIRRAGVGPVVDVIVRNGDHRRQGIRVHVRPDLRPEDVTVQRGIPVTTPARTLLDLAAVAPTRELEGMVVEALGKRLIVHAELAELTSRHPRRAGSVRLRALIEPMTAGHTQSAAERRFLALIRRARIGAPEVNAEVAGMKVDFVWRAKRLVVEIDGRAFHSTAGRFESDRRRDLELTAAGFRVVRVSWRHLTNEPEALVVRIARLLDAETQ
jgi:very-short-patch-repair endonuclease/predicted transcriptional regulator of viral defense system